MLSGDYSEVEPGTIKKDAKEITSTECMDEEQSVFGQR
jgi:hypothetical protein